MNNELIELQTRIAFQEETVSQLSDVITDQQKQIDLMKQEFRLLQERYEEMLDRVEAPQAGGERPPHY